MRVAFDATALGSGLGGDETFLAGVLEGLAAHADAADEFPLFVRSGVDLPTEIANDGRFPVHSLDKRPGPIHTA